MSFPTVPVVDDANRANEGPPPSSSWGATPSMISGVEVNSNQFASDGSYGFAWWDTQYNDDQESFTTIATPAANGDFTRVMARLGSLGSAATVTGYGVSAVKSAGTDSVYILRFNGNGTETTLATYSQEFSAGDKIGIRCRDDTIQAWYDDGTGWTKLGETTDANYSSGYNGIFIQNTTARLDDFGAGSVRANALFNNPAPLKSRVGGNLVR